MLVIEPDKNSIFEDQALRLVLLFCGQEVKDKLLYEGDLYYRLSGSASSTFDRGDHLEFGRGDNPGNRQAEGFSA